MEHSTTTSLEDASTEDPKLLDKVVVQMISNIPEPAIDNVKETAQNPGSLPDIKVALLSKSLPPVLKTSNAPKICKLSSLSPPPVIHPQPIIQDRPSVLRVAPARQPAVIHNQQTDEKPVNKDKEYMERRGEVLILQKRQIGMQLLPEHSPKKAKFGVEPQIKSPAYSHCSNPIDESSLNNQLTEDDYNCIDQGNELLK